MTKTLLLVRHGKAKTLAEGQQDFERELTEAGRRSLEACLPTELAPLGKKCGSVQVWSSPAARAMQTAKLVAKALKKMGIKVDGGVLEHDELWTQETIALIEQLDRCDADTVIAVGHNPFIEATTEYLSGARIPYATGAIGALSIDFEALASRDMPMDANSMQRARLLWFSQGPVSQRWKTLVSFEKVLKSGINTVLARRDDFFENPNDIETMHKFRVSIRTLRSLVAFVKPWQEASQNSAMQVDLKEIVGATSRLRELDVLCEQARSASFSSPALVSFCEEEAARERESVKKVLSCKKTEKRLERVANNAECIRWKDPYVQEGLPATQARARFDELAANLEHDLSVLDLKDVEPTHDVRKNAKRVRYVAENFSDVVGDDAAGIAKGMTAHQDNLGAICDARVNIDIINGFTGRDLPEEVAWDLALLRAQNETFLYTTLRDSR